MKFVIASGVLKSLLESVLLLGTKDATHPGFGLLHLEATKKGSVRATVVNSQASVRMARTTLSQDEKSHAAGAAALTLGSAQVIASALANDDTPTAVSVLDNGVGRAQTMRIKSGAILLKTPLDSIDNIAPFPTPPADDAVAWQEMSPADHRTVVERVAWTCEPPSGVRPNLQGLYMTPDFTEATNGHTLMRYGRGFTPRPVLVPPAIMSAASRIAGNQPIKIACDVNRIWIKGPWFMTTCRLIEGVFPNTAELWFFPDAAGTVKTNTGRVKPASSTVKAKQLAAAGSLMSSSGPKDDSPIMRFLTKESAPDVLNALMYSGRAGIDVNVSCQWHMDDGVGQVELGELHALCLDAKYVLSVLQTMSSQDDVGFSWLTSMDRVQFTGGDILGIIMPLDPTKVEK